MTTKRMILIFGAALLTTARLAQSARADFVLYANQFGFNTSGTDNSGSIYQISSSGAGSLAPYYDIADNNGIAFDSSKNFYVSQSNQNDTSSPNNILKFLPNGSRAIFANDPHGPLALAAGLGGNLYTTNSDGTIAQINSAGVVSILNIANGYYDNNRAFGPLVVSGSDIYFVSESLSPGSAESILEVSSVGGPTSLIYAGSDLNDPSALALDSDDNLFVANYYGGADSAGDILRITPGGNESEFAHSPLISGPAGLAIDPSGNLYASSQNNGTIVEVTPSGNINTFATTGGTPGALAIEQISSIPEPSGLSLLAIGGAALLHRCRRR